MNATLPPPPPPFKKEKKEREKKKKKKKKKGEKRRKKKKKKKEQLAVPADRIRYFIWTVFRYADDPQVRYHWTVQCQLREAPCDASVGSRENKGLALSSETFSDRRACAIVWTGGLHAGLSLIRHLDDCTLIPYIASDTFRHQPLLIRHQPLLILKVFVQTQSWSLLLHCSCENKMADTLREFCAEYLLTLKAPKSQCRARIFPLLSHLCAQIW